MTTGTSERWVEHALRTLAEAGYRKGGARRTVVEMLARQPCAVTARDIDDALRAADQAVGRASVYRTLEQLDELRLVQRFDVGEGMRRYERIDPDGDHHHHMVCNRCGRLTPFEDHKLEETLAQVSQRVAFDVADHDVVLHGVCRSCPSEG